MTDEQIDYWTTLRALAGDEASELLADWDRWAADARGTAAIARTSASLVRRIDAEVADSSETIACLMQSVAEAVDEHRALLASRIGAE